MYVTGFDRGVRPSELIDQHHFDVTRRQAFDNRRRGPASRRFFFFSPAYNSRERA
jgi:hypothetical protein